jgi:hypothetical protein
MTTRSRPRRGTSSSVSPHCGRINAITRHIAAATRQSALSHRRVLLIRGSNRAASGRSMNAASDRRRRQNP